MLRMTWLRKYERVFFHICLLKSFWYTLAKPKFVMHSGYYVEFWSFIIGLDVNSIYTLDFTVFLPRVPSV